jgi:hypothetical protein
MKRIILTFVLITAVCFGSFARKLVSQGKTNTSFGNYKIEVDDGFMFLNGLQHKPYVITYENSNFEVKVAVTLEKGKKIYYVLSDALSVKYVSTSKYFGVEKLGDELEEDGYSTSDSALNRDQYFHQKVITSGKNLERDNTSLIAAYFPMLLNNQESFLATK